ncbi:MAG: ArsR/SmtB family transcription factor [Microbacterium sp.]
MAADVTRGGGPATHPAQILRPVTELARELGIPQPGTSKHLPVLREVGLICRLIRQGSRGVSLDESIYI